MKSPLHYQVSEFDCGPTTVLNALSYLFQREDLPAELGEKHYDLLSGLLQ